MDSPPFLEAEVAWSLSVDLGPEVDCLVQSVLPGLSFSKLATR